MFLQTSSFSFHSRAVPIISITVFAGMLSLQKLEMAETCSVIWFTNVYWCWAVVDAMCVCGLIFSSQVQEHTKNYDRSGSVHLSLVLHVSIRNICRVLVITFKMVMNKIIFLNVYERYFISLLVHIYSLLKSPELFSLGMWALTQKPNEFIQIIQEYVGDIL